MRTLTAIGYLVTRLKKNVKPNYAISIIIISYRRFSYITIYTFLNNNFIFNKIAESDLNFKVLQAQVGVLNDERAEEKEFDTFI